MKPVQDNHTENLGPTAYQKLCVRELRLASAKIRRMNSRVINSAENMNRLVSLRSRCSVSDCQGHGIYRGMKSTRLFCSDHRREASNA